MAEWIGIQATERTLTGWRFDGAARQAVLSPEDCRAAFGATPPDRLLLAGAEGAPPEDLPANLMPERLLSGPQSLVLPGLAQARPRHRIDGDRLAAIGFLALNDGWDGVICLPGPVTHWLQVSAGEAIFLHGALTLSLAEDFGPIAAPDAGACDETLSRPEKLAGALRGAQLSGDAGAALGSLLGVELASARAMWLGQQVAVLGDGAGGKAYAQVLTAQGVPVTQGPAAAMAEKGMLALGTRFGLAG